MKNLLVLHLICCMLFVTSLLAEAQELSSKELLIGRWELCTQDGERIERPNVRQKVYTKDSYVVLEIDKSNNTTYMDFIGKTTIDDEGKLIETVLYADPRMREMTFRNYKFTFRVEGEYLYLEGIGNPFNEVWARISD